MERSSDSSLLSDLIRREGGVVVITGELTYCDRMTMMDVLEALGLKVSASVSSRSAFLLCGANPQQKKVDQAIERSVPVFTETEFWKVIDELHPPE